MKNKTLFSFLLAFVFMSAIVSCSEDDAVLPNEPISVVMPDSSISRFEPGDVVPIEIKFTTDRPINWAKGMYDIDSLGNAGYVATYPDTLFFVKLDTIEPLVNLYTYSGQYTVPDSIALFSTIRFKVSFEAGKNSFTTGQNYPAGKVSSSKEFRIDIR